MNAYIMSTTDEFGLNPTAARVLLNAMPELKSADVFKVHTYICVCIYFQIL